MYTYNISIIQQGVLCLKQQFAISNESLQKVEMFFKSETIDSINEPVIATVLDIAQGSGVALATAHKAIKELEKRGVLKIIKPQSRREPIQYIYSERREKSKEELEALVKEYESTIKELKKKLSFYESDLDSIKVITVDDNLELIVKQKKS